jgi:hypothetical protein
LPYDPAIPFRDTPEGYNKGTCIPMFIAAVFTIAKVWKQPRCPTTIEWIKKCGMYIPLYITYIHCIYTVCIYNGILFSHQEE